MMDMEDARFNVELYFRGGRPGGFFSALMEAFGRADSHNFERLRTGFPEVAQAIEEWNRGELKEVVWH